MADLLKDQRLNARFSVVATFQGSANADNAISMQKPSDSKYIPEDEFIAIAEGKTLPIYIITYNIEMTQFIYTDLMETDDDEEILDKTIAARHHAQFLS